MSGFLNKIALAVITTLIFLVIAELVLRCFLLVPGELSYNVKIPVYDRKNYIANEYGIMVHNIQQCWDDIPGGINEDGFRGRPFYQAPADKTSILFIGDSYTYGSTAIPLNKCFVDLVDSAGYHTYNAGIPGTDLAQYLAIAEVYLPRIKPDYCLLMICENDYTGLRRPVIPYQPLFYSTDLGALDGYYIEDNKLFPHSSFEDAHNYNLGQADFYTSIGTLLFLATYNVEPPYDVMLMREYITRVQQICYEQDVKLKIIPIPGHDKFKVLSAELYEDFEMAYPANLEWEDYYHRDNDTHLNNRGHRKYARFIMDSVLGTNENSWQ